MEKNKIEIGFYDKEYHEVVSASASGRGRIGLSRRCGKYLGLLDFLNKEKIEFNYEVRYDVPFRRDPKSVLAMPIISWRPIKTRFEYENKKRKLR